MLALSYVANNTAIKIFHFTPPAYVTDNFSININAVFNTRLYGNDSFFVVRLKNLPSVIPDINQLTVLPTESIYISTRQTRR